MKKKKFEKRFQELIQYSMEENNTTFCLQMDNGQINFVGIKNTPERLNTTVILIQKNDGLFIKGSFDSVKFNYSSIPEFNTSDPLYLGVDSRNIFDHLIYFQLGHKFEYFNSEYSIQKDEKLYLYWEVDGRACLTICGHDPINDEVIREVSYGQTKQQIQFLQTIVRHTLISNCDSSVYPILDNEGFDTEGESVNYVF